MLRNRVSNVDPTKMWIVSGAVISDLFLNITRFGQFSAGMHKPMGVRSIQLHRGLCAQGFQYSKHICIILLHSYAIDWTSWTIERERWWYARFSNLLYERVLLQKCQRFWKCFWSKVENCSIEMALEFDQTSCSILRWLDGSHRERESKYVNG